MLKFNLKNPSFCSRSNGSLIKGLLLFMTAALFSFVQIQAQEAVLAEDKTNTNFTVDAAALETANGAKFMSWAKNDILDAVENPDLAASVTCSQLRVTLLLDESGSILNRDGVEQVEEATLALAEVLLGTPALLSIVEFENKARTIFPSQPVTPAFLADLASYLSDDSLDVTIDGEIVRETYDPTNAFLNQPCPFGNTNWEAALQEAGANNPNLLIFLTDGEPVSRIDDTNPCGFVLGGGVANLNAAIEEANFLREDQGVHIFGYGVGTGVIIPNLILASGEDEFLPNGGNIFTDDYSTGSFEDLADNLSAGLNALCGVELDIDKMAQPSQICGGETVTYTITIDNLGNAELVNISEDAANVVVEDILPSGFELDVIPAGATFDGSVLTWELGTITEGQEPVVLTYSGNFPGANAEFVNTATVNASNALEEFAEATVTKSATIITEFDEENCLTFDLVASNYVANPDPNQDQTVDNLGLSVVEVTGTNEAGCPVVATVNVTINDVPEPIVESFDPVCSSFFWDRTGETYGPEDVVEGADPIVAQEGEGDCAQQYILDVDIQEQVVLELVTETACPGDDFSGLFGQVTIDNVEIGVLYEIELPNQQGGCPFIYQVIFELGVDCTDCPDGNIGDACDDGDENTENDVLGEDCVCAGTPIVISSDCLNEDSFGSADIAADGPNGQLILISGCSWQVEYATVTGVPAGEDIEFSIVEGGYITVRTDSADGAVVAEGFSPVTVAAASGSDLFAHWNTDDLCGTATDCIETQVQCATCPTECPDGNIGDACDDGDADTTDDTIGADCVCAGIPLDCPGLGNIGDACDDGDENTVGDVVGEDCTCAGQPLTGDCLNEDAFGDADLSTAANELILISSCSWQVEYSTITGVPAGQDIEFSIVEGGYITVRSDSVNGAVVAQGTSPVTVVGASGSDLFAHWNTDGSCGTATNCVNTQVQCTTCGTDCPDGNIGDACDDGNPLTSGETLQADCSCGGGIVAVENDDCASATDLVCGGSVDGTTVGATITEGINNLCNGFTSPSPEDVWYSFEADGSSSYTITVDTNAATSSSLMDAVIFVYSGACDNLTEIGCADENFSSSFTGETFTLDAPAAGTYYVRVFNWNAGGEIYTISLECESGCADPFPAVNEESLSTTFLGDSYLVEWEPVAGQIGCQLQLRFANGVGVQRTIAWGEDASSQVIPGSILAFASDYEWRVRCGCSEEPIVAGPFSSWQPFTTPGSAISSLPNPTEGQSNVTFTVAEEGYTTLEVFDMSGRLVDAIFTGNTQPNNEYRFEFDGSALPNGVYIYRLTTESEVLNEKFMIAR